MMKPENNNLELTVKEAMSRISNVAITGTGSIAMGVFVVYNLGSLVFNYEPIHDETLGFAAANGIAAYTSLIFGVMTYSETQEIHKYSKTANSKS